MDRNVPPFLIPFVGLITGVCIGLESRIYAWALLPLFAGIALAAGIHTLSALPGKARKINSLHYLWILFIFAGSGIIAGAASAPGEIADSLIDKDVWISGEVLESRSSTSGDVYIFDAKEIRNVDGERFDLNNVKVLLVTDGISWKTGQLMSIPVLLRNFDDNPLSEEYVRSLKNKGICYKAFYQGEDVVVSLGHGFSIRSFAESLRDEVEILIEKSNLSRQGKAFVIAMLCGDKDFMTSSDLSQFADAGVSHIMAVSGMHIGILVALLSAILFPLNIFIRGRWRFVLIVALLWFFVIFTGMAPSTVRSAIMATCCFIAGFIQRKNSAFNALLFAGCMILMVSPWSVYDPGAQLSFLCVAALVLFSDKFNLVERHIHPTLYKINSMFIVTLVATLSTWVVSAYHFRQLPVFFLPVNILILPFLPATMGLALLYIVLLSFGINVDALANILDIIVETIFQVTEFFSSGSVSCLNISVLHIIFWMVALIALYAGICCVGSRKKYYLGCALTVMALVATDIFIGADAVSRSHFVVDKGVSQISAVIKDTNGFNRITFPRGCVSRIIGKKINVLAVDRFISDNEWNELIDIHIPNLIIIGGGFKGSLPSKVFSPRVTFVVHTTVRRKKERELIDKLGVSGFRTLVMRCEKMVPVEF